MAVMKAFLMAERMAGITGAVKVELMVVSKVESLDPSMVDWLVVSLVECLVVLMAVRKDIYLVAEMVVWSGEMSNEQMDAMMAEMLAAVMADMKEF